MSGTNGKSPIEQAFALLDAMDAEACERVRLRLAELEHERLVREVEHQKALDRELNRKRSLMSAKQKSDLINEIGKARYDQIPW